MVPATNIFGVRQEETHWFPFVRLRLTTEQLETHSLFDEASMKNKPEQADTQVKVDIVVTAFKV